MVRQAILVHLAWKAREVIQVRREDTAGVDVLVLLVLMVLMARRGLLVSPAPLGPLARVDGEASRGQSAHQA